MVEDQFRCAYLVHAVNASKFWVHLAQNWLAFISFAGSLLSSRWCKLGDWELPSWFHYFSHALSVNQDVFQLALEVLIDLDLTRIGSRNWRLRSTGWIPLMQLIIPALAHREIFSQLRRLALSLNHLVWFSVFLEVACPSTSSLKVLLANHLQEGGVP